MGGWDGKAGSVLPSFLPSFPWHHSSIHPTHTNLHHIHPPTQSTYPPNKAVVTPATELRPPGPNSFMPLSKCPRAKPDAARLRPAAAAAAPTRPRRVRRTLVLMLWCGVWDGKRRRGRRRRRRRRRTLLLSGLDLSLSLSTRCPFASLPCGWREGGRGPVVIVGRVYLAKGGWVWGWAVGVGAVGCCLCVMEENWPELAPRPLWWVCDGRSPLATGRGRKERRL